MDTKVKKTKVKKVQVCRMSGQPVEPEQGDMYMEKWKAFFDTVQEYYAQDMMKVHTLLERYEGLLMRAFKHHIVTEWDEIKSQKDWSKAVDKYGPILVAKEQDTGKLLYVIADQMG